MFVNVLNKFYMNYERILIIFFAKILEKILKDNQKFAGRFSENFAQTYNKF